MKRYHNILYTFKFCVQKNCSCTNPFNLVVYLMGCTKPFRNAFCIAQQFKIRGQRPLLIYTRTLPLIIKCAQIICKIDEDNSDCSYLHAYMQIH